MTIKFIGEYPEVEKMPTGFWSFDKAMGGGLPMRSCYEIYGPTQSGKTSFAQSLAGKSGSPGRIYFMEIEGRLDKKYVKSNLSLVGYDGEIMIIPSKRSKKKEWSGIDHEACLNELANGLLLDPKATAGILDSLGAIVSVGQASSEIGEASVGREAKLVWQLLRKSVYALNRGRLPEYPPANLFLISHTHGVIGGRGYTTSGGTAPDYLSTCRISMWPGDYEADGSFAIKGTVTKATYSPAKQKFHVFLLTGVGVHPGLSAMIDCTDLGIAKRESRGVILGGENIGRIGTLLSDARSNKNSRFNAFHEALKEYKDDNG